MYLIWDVSLFYTLFCANHSLFLFPFWQTILFSFWIKKERNLIMSSAFTYTKNFSISHVFIAIYSPYSSHTTRPVAPGVISSVTRRCVSPRGSLAFFWYWNQNRRPYQCTFPRITEARGGFAFARRHIRSSGKPLPNSEIQHFFRLCFLVSFCSSLSLSLSWYCLPTELIFSLSFSLSLKLMN